MDSMKFKVFSSDYVYLGVCDTDIADPTDLIDAGFHIVFITDYD